MNYQEKYLKYKQKYLNKKKLQIGGRSLSFVSMINNDKKDTYLVLEDNLTFEDYFKYLVALQSIDQFPENKEKLKFDQKLYFKNYLLEKVDYYKNLDPNDAKIEHLNKMLVKLQNDDISDIKMLHIIRYDPTKNNYEEKFIQESMCDINTPVITEYNEILNINIENSPKYNLFDKVKYDDISYEIIDIYNSDLIDSRNPSDIPIKLEKENKYVYYLYRLSAQYERFFRVAQEDEITPYSSK